MTSLKTQFKSIYESNYPKVIRMCLGYTNGDIAWSEDLAQETFIKVWQNLDTFRNASSISTWIYRITVNTCLLELRNKKPLRLSKELYNVEQINDDSAVAKEHQLKRLYQCISTLKTENKSIILLELEGLPQKEIAEIMGLSHDVIRVRIHRIKDELTKCVKK